MTMVRQFDGTLSIVPNGGIHVTSNKTRGWGRAIVDLRVSIAEDPERIREVLEELIDELTTADPLGMAAGSPAGVRRHPAHRCRTGHACRRGDAAEPPGDAERYLRERITQRFSERGIRVPPVTGAGAAPARAGL